MAGTVNNPVVQVLKDRFVSSERSNHKIKRGIYKGIEMSVVPRESLQLLYGLWEVETYAYIRKGLSAKWMIDVGAGHGEMVALFARHSATNPIYAVEADIPSAAITRDTLKRNKVADDAVEVIAEFVGTGDGQVALDSFALSPGRGFIKIDVDGGEVDVLRSGQAMLAAQKPMLLIETHTVELETECIRILEDIGLKVKVIRNGWYRKFLPENRTIEHNRWLWAE